jgi:hypothetical protein
MMVRKFKDETIYSVSDLLTKDLINYFSYFNVCLRPKLTKESNFRK